MVQGHSYLTNFLLAFDEEDEKNDKRIPRESMERDSELENATLPQQIKKERKKSRDLHP